MLLLYQQRRKFEVKLNVGNLKKSQCGGESGEEIQVPKLASAAEYFFKMGAEGKKFRPMVGTIILLMASALNMSTIAPDGVVDLLHEELRSRQLSIAVITEMIHLMSVINRRLLVCTSSSSSFPHTYKLMWRVFFMMMFWMMQRLGVVLAGDFLLSRACVALASLRNNEFTLIIRISILLIITISMQVVTLIAKSVKHLVTGETMQMTTASEQRCSMEYYMEKTYNKTASLISNSCQAVTIITGQTAEVSMLAYDYGRNLGLAFQLIDDVLDFTGTSASLGKGSLSDIRHGIVTAPILFAMEEFPQLRKIVDRGFHNPDDVDLAIEILGKSNGIQRAIELASEHANLAAAAIRSLPETDNVDARRSRQALIDLTQIVITRKKKESGW
ncbi:hypothetical protein C5167_038871 [Papaver somniferum]|uniref:Uncharacterized protein n=1 Tax=Papaver somniferum TaxID=3469 RepID=A0A4Y7IE35_PAPSO|nr:hypothetical protein C5167_038871 [Papaver somniferum]